VHVDDVSDTNRNKLLDLLVTPNLVQHVTTPTHVHGHTLDLVITHNDLPVTVPPTDPPLMSDHAFVTNQKVLKI